MSTCRIAATFCFRWAVSKHSRTMLEPENEKYKALEATANLAHDPDGAAIVDRNVAERVLGHKVGDRAIELEIGQLPDDEREVLRDKVRSRLNRPLARRY